MSGPKILPVKPIKENKKILKYHPYLPNINKGALVGLISPICTGKSTIISNLILNKEFYKDKFDEVYIFSNTIYIDDTSRFLKEKYNETIFDQYSDEVLKEIIDNQKSYSKKDMPKIAIIIDDFIGIGSSSQIFNLACRFRHYNIGLLLFATQRFRSLPVVIRQNLCNLILLGPNPNSNEMDKIAEEFSAPFGGKENFLKLFYKTTEKKYDFLNLVLTSNPSIAYKNFEVKIYEGKNL